MKLYISLPKKYDKTAIIFVRIPAKKRQKVIKVKWEMTDEK